MNVTKHFPSLLDFYLFIFTFYKVVLLLLLSQKEIYLFHHWYDLLIVSKK